MDKQDLFDALTIRFSDVRARRDVLRLLGQAGAGHARLRGLSPGGCGRRTCTDESLLVKGCRLPGQKCSGKQDCCAKKCDSEHRCGCISKGREPLVDTPLGPVPVKALCCSNKLNKRTEECR